MNTTTSPLDAAREHLLDRLYEADRADDYDTRRWLSPLHSVADMVCRIGDHDHSPHYQCDKAGDMVYDALRVRRETQRRYAGQTGDDDTRTDKVIDDLTDAAEDIESAVERALWSTSRFALDGVDGAVRMADVYAIRDALAKLDRLADRLAASARPDPELDL